MNSRKPSSRPPTALELEYAELYVDTVASFQWRKEHTDAEFDEAWKKLKAIGARITEECLARRKKGSNLPRGNDYGWLKE